MKYIKTINDFIPGKIYKATIKSNIGYTSVEYTHIFLDCKPFVFIKTSAYVGYEEYITAVLCGSNRRSLPVRVGTENMIQSSQFIELE